ncbi:hypothetical protein BH10PSE7_BH10PSE7_36980 [soil metagenome]
MARPPRDEEARRDLKRLDEQSEKLLGAQSTDNPNPDDPIERLGKRIARILSVALFLGLVFYLWRTYFTR